MAHIKYGADCVTYGWILLWIVFNYCTERVNFKQKAESYTY